MGCSTSKAEEPSQALALCRKRRDLIRSAADRSCAFASAHAAYFRSLRAVGDALHGFVQEELSVASESLPSESPAHIPQGRDTRPNNPRSVTSASDCLSTISASTEGSHLNISVDSSSCFSSEEQMGRRDRKEEPTPFPSPIRPFSAVPSPNGSYFRDATTPGDWYGLSSHFGTSVPDGPPPSKTPTPPRTPPLPSPYRSGWDFLDPFCTNEMYSGYKLGSVTSSINSAEAREREGIPELEDDTEEEVAKEEKAKKRSGPRVSVGKVSRRGRVSKPSPLGLNSVTNNHVEKGISSNSSSECIASRSSSKHSTLKESNSEDEKRTKGWTDKEDDSVKKKTVAFDVETSLATERSAPSIGTSFLIKGTRNIRETTQEIRKEFMDAASSGEDLFEVIEFGKFHYRPKNTALTALFSRISDSLSMLAYSFPMLNSMQFWSASAQNRLKVAQGDLGKFLDMKISISSTLYKLCEWENKLYEEVKEEEKLCARYRKKFKHLNILIETGADPNKIKSARTLITELLAKAKITFKSIDAISRKMQKLRDEELQPQLSELISSLQKMWTFLLDCHRKQYCAIVYSKTSNIEAKTGIEGESIAKATLELKRNILNWSTCFKNWVSTQKAYIEALNEWLMKWLDVEPEVTPDGVVPFSPGRIGAPAIFISCNDWYHAINVVLEEHPVEEITVALQHSANILHRLWETQKMEQHQKLKADMISKDLNRRLHSFEKGSKISLRIRASDRKAVFLSRKYRSDRRVMVMDLIRERLSKEKAKHEESLKRVNEIASNSLHFTFIPIFEALGSFTVETVKAYENLRLPDIVGGS